MSTNGLAVRMKFRKFDADQLAEVINSEDYSEMEVQIASEMLAKLEGENEAISQNEEKKTPPKKAKGTKKKTPPKSAQVEEEVGDDEDPTPVSAMKRQNKVTTNIPPEIELTDEEEERLAEAEAEFDERQLNRKTVSKKDNSMKTAAVKKEKQPRTVKRKNLEESIEVPGMVVGSKVTVDGDEGEVTRIYQSGDGKEKCMVKLDSGKIVKKRVTTVQVAENKPIPKKK